MNNCTGIFQSVLKDDILLNWSQFTASGFVSMFPIIFFLWNRTFFEPAKGRYLKGSEVSEMQIKNFAEKYMMFLTEVKVQFLI